MTGPDRSEPRLSALPPEDWGDDEYDAFGVLLGVPGAKVPRAGSGHRYDPVNFSVVGTMVRHPELTKAFLAFNGYLLQRSLVPVRERELAILRVAARRRSGYEWGQHVKIALDAGITDAEIDRLATGNEGFEGLDRTVLEATDELLEAGRIGDSSWEALHRVLDTRQVMDLVFIVGTYALLAMAFETWGLQPEPGTAALPSVP